MQRIVAAIVTAGFLATAARGESNAAAPALPPGPLVLKIDATKRGPEIHPFIYGQFIEHLGRCIYGGIWAEMLEDRKFYFPVTPEYAPYKSLQQTAFPVVGASPWKIVGEKSGVTMTTEAPFVGDQSVKIAPGSGIAQHDLAVVKGKKYVGYVWLRSAGAGEPQVKVSLSTGDNSSANQALSGVSGAYAKHEFSFEAPASSDHATLSLVVGGKTPVVVGTLSLMPADNVRGMRADTLAALKQLDATIYRWPGGNFVSGYDWRDGIGDRDRRPPRKNPAWTGVEHNDFGLDEYLDFCQEVGAKPLITVNTGFGDDYSAAQEVEYVNGAADTVAGGWRAKNGHAAPYDVKHWCVGNEMFGNWQLGYMSLDQYEEKHRRFVKAMKRVDPSIEVVGVGDLAPPKPEEVASRKTSWSEGMLGACADSMNLISEHFYCGRTPWNADKSAIAVAKHMGLLRAEIRKKAADHRALQKKLGLFPDRIVPISMDEWNYWHSDYEYGELGCPYDLADALGVAAGLHEYFRNTDIIKWASYAQTVNVIGCIKTTKTAAFLDTTALPLLAYRKHFGTIPVEATGDFEARGLDVVAALTEDGSALTIGVVNANGAEVKFPIEIAGVKIAGPAQQWLAGGGDPKARNTAEKAALELRESTVDLSKEYAIPAYSFAVLRVPVSKD